MNTCNKLILHTSWFFYSIFKLPKHTRYFWCFLGYLGLFSKYSCLYQSVHILASSLLQLGGFTFISAPLLYWSHHSFLQLFKLYYFGKVQCCEMWQEYSAYAAVQPPSQFGGDRNFWRCSTIDVNILLYPFYWLLYLVCAWFIEPPT